MTDPSHTGPIAGRQRRCVIRFFVVMLVLLGADLLIKHYAFKHVAGVPVDLSQVLEQPNLDVIPPHRETTVIPKVLALRLTLNQGAVFGLGQGGRWIFVGFTAIALIVLFTMFLRTPARAVFTQLVFAAIVAGALGNLYDRLAFGGVRDMFHMLPGVPLPFGWKWGNGTTDIYPWIFNAADVFLVVGLFCLALMSLRAAPNTSTTSDSSN